MTRNSAPSGARIVDTFFDGQPMRWIVDIDAVWLQPHGTGKKSKQHFPIHHAHHEGPGALCTSSFMKLDPSRTTGPSGYCITCVDMLLHHNEYKEITVPTTSDILRQQMSAIAAEIARLESLPKEPMPDEEDAVVITFEKTFGRDRSWTYAAVRAGDGLWYSTGPKAPKGYTWQQFIEWIADSEPEMPTIWLATDYEALS